MTRFIKSRSKSLGKSPGSLIFIGNKKLEKARIRVIKYNTDELIEKEPSSVSEAFDFVDSNHITWINIDGLHDSDLVSEIGQRFKITSLALEDIMNTDHRPKLSEADEHIAIITKALEIRDDNKLMVDQVSFIIGSSYIISFQETNGIFFEPVRERIRNSIGKIRTRGSDYLCYALMDTLVDNYLTTLMKFGEIIEEQEDRLHNSSDPELLNEIYALKKDTVILRKNIRPFKEVTNLILRSESILFYDDSRIYFTDLDELLTQATETIEIYYNLVNDHLAIYHANVSNGVNSVMKVLTIFASIFIPLTFIAGVYGTNFKYIPELEYRNGYFYMLALMALVAIVMLIFFRRKRWL